MKKFIVCFMALTWLAMLSASTPQSIGGSLDVVVSRMGRPYNTKFCYDQNFILTRDGNCIYLWDLNKRRLARKLECDTKYMTPSPLGTEWVNIKDRNDDIHKKYYTVNLVTGKYIPAAIDEQIKFTDKYFLSHHPDLDIKEVDKGIVLLSKEGTVIDTLKSVRTLNAGRIAIDRNDSLLLVSGTPSIVYDLKNACVHAVLDRTVEMYDDSTIYWPKGYCKTDGHFLSDGTLQISLKEKGARIYFTDGSLKDSIKTDEAIYAFSEYNGHIVAGVMSGLYSGDLTIGKVSIDTLLNVNPAYDTRLPNRNVYDIEKFSCDSIYVAGTMFGELFVGNFVNPKSYQRLNLGDIDSTTAILYGLPFDASSYFSKKTHNAVVDVAVSPNDQYVLAINSCSLEVPVCEDSVTYTYDNYRRFYPYVTKVGCYVNDSTIVMGSSRGDLGLWKHGDFQHKKYIPYAHEDGITDILLSNDQTKIICASGDGTITIWSSADMEKIMTIYPLGVDGDYVFITPDNFYKASKNSLESISFVRGLDAFSFEQFDLLFNRPDIVLERLGVSDERSNTYTKAWEKRLARAGVDQQSLFRSVDVPELAISNYAEIKKITDNNFVELVLDAYDVSNQIQKLNVTLNGVRLLVTDKFIETCRQQWSDHDRHFLFKQRIELVHGNNHIEISMTNDAGVESYPSEIDVYCNAKTDKRTLYVAGIGVSSYLQSEYNLEYAHKDAHDFTTLIKDVVGKHFDEVKVLDLYNEQFADTSMIQIEDFFAEGQRNDVQLMLYAGHGVLDNELNYYLATYNMDFGYPALHGVPYERFENVFERSRSINKVCFIDACHSGEVFKDDYQIVEKTIIRDSPLVFRNAGKDIEVLSQETRRISSLINDIFVDVRRNSGVTVISSAGSAELAFEDKQWNNGLFTWCLKDGLLNDYADLNKDGNIELNELATYLRTKVSSLSRNVQTPVVRVANKYSDRIILK